MDTLPTLTRVVDSLNELQRSKLGLLLKNATADEWIEEISGSTGCDIEQD